MNLERDDLDAPLRGRPGWFKTGVIEVRRQLRSFAKARRRRSREMRASRLMPSARTAVTGLCILLFGVVNQLRYFQGALAEGVWTKKGLIAAPIVLGGGLLLATGCFTVWSKTVRVLRRRRCMRQASHERAWRRVWHQRRVRCSGCGYPLADIPHDEDAVTRCPECGAAWLLFAPRK